MHLYVGLILRQTHITRLRPITVTFITLLICLILVLMEDTVY